MTKVQNRTVWHRSSMTLIIFYEYSVAWKTPFHNYLGRILLTGLKQSFFSYSVTVWHAIFFWPYFFWTRKRGGWPGMFFVIVWTLTNHNINDFAPPSRNQSHIFRCHIVTNCTDLKGISSHTCMWYYFILQSIGCDCACCCVLLGKCYYA